MSLHKFYRVAGTLTILCPSNSSLRHIFFIVDVMVQIQLKERMGTEDIVKMRLLKKHTMWLHKDRTGRRRVRYSLVKAAMPFPNMAFIKTEFPASSGVGSTSQGLTWSWGNYSSTQHSLHTEYNLLPEPHSCSDEIIQHFGRRKDKAYIARHNAIFSLSWFHLPQ